MCEFAECAGWPGVDLQVRGWRGIRVGRCWDGELGERVEAGGAVAELEQEGCRRLAVDFGRWRGRRCHCGAAAGEGVEKSEGGFTAFFAASTGKKGLVLTEHEAVIRRAELSGPECMTSIRGFNASRSKKFDMLFILMARGRIRTSKLKKLSRLVTHPI